MKYNISLRYLDNKRSVYFDLIFLTVLALIFCFTNIWAGSLRDWDEATYALVAKEFFQKGNWLVPAIEGHLWFHKPPFVMWFMSLGFSVFGVGEFAVRFGSAIAGVGTIIITYLFTRKMFCSNTALLAGLVLLGIPHFVSHAKMGMLDVPLTFFITLSLFSYYKSIADSRWWLVSGAAFGIAFMIKGVAAGIAPFTILLHILIMLRFKQFRSLYMWAGIGIALVILLPWHVLLVYRYGEIFWNEYFMYHVINRGASAIEDHAGSHFYYFWVLIKEARPWFLAAFPAIIYCTLISWKKRDKRILFLVCWTFSVFFIISVFSTKLEWYIIPLYPPLSVCISAFLLRLFPSRHFSKIIAGCVVILVINGIFCHRIFDLDYQPDIKALGPRIKAEVPLNENIYIYKVNQPSVAFYGERHVLQFSSEELSKHFDTTKENGNIYVLTRERDIEQLFAMVPGKAFEIIESQGDHLFVKIDFPNNVW
ncbi:MAG: ArnT family glycosyltransferase [Candidatus Anammoxibacter sp.]